jgi:hypothetical protein
MNVLISEGVWGQERMQANRIQDVYLQGHIPSEVVANTLFRSTQSQTI